MTKALNDPRDVLARLTVNASVALHMNMKMRLAVLPPGQRVCTPVDTLHKNDLADWRDLPAGALPPADARDWLIAGPLGTHIPIAFAKARLEPPEKVT